MTNALTPAQQRQEDTKQQLAELLELTEGLSGWEMDFIENVSHQQAGGFAPGTRDKIKEIYEQQILRL